MNQIFKENDCSKDNIFDKSSRKNRKMGKETYNIIQEYSEYSTIQGIVYIFQRSQTTFGKIFWNIVVVMMLILGTYWSVEAYNSWENNQVKLIVNIKSLLFLTTSLYIWIDSRAIIVQDSSVLFIANPD